MTNNDSDRITLSGLAARLAATPAQNALVFAPPGDEISGNYHVTELKVADVTGIDCGGNITRWREAALQLLDGSGGLHMQAGKFLAILRRSLTALPDLGPLPLQIEFAAGNAGLQLYVPGPLTASGDVTRLSLLPGGALCKPAALGACGTEISGCSGSSGVADQTISTGCCGTPAKAA